MSEWVKAAELGRCPPGNHLGVQIAGHPIVIANVNGDLYALRDVCSHQEFPLSDGELEGSRLQCIYHGAEFDVCSGKALGLPAVTAVKSFPVDVRDGDVYVKIG